MTSAVTTALSALIVAVGYLALSPTLSPGEAAFALVAILLYRLLLHALPSFPKVVVPPSETRPRIGQVLADTVRVSASGWKRPAGTFVHITVVDKRALPAAALALSVAPNAYAVDDEGDAIRVHRLMEE